MKYKLLEDRPAKKLATPDKKLVVEGFPRSGNTFLSDFIIVTQPTGFAFAHHTHLAENVLMGIDNGVPAIVLVRNPVDAISSFVIYSDKSIAFSIEKWIDFYKALENAHDSLLVVKFDTIIERPIEILTAINERFSINLDVPTCQQDVMLKVEQRIKLRSEAMANREDESRRKDFVKTSCLPTAERDQLKKNIISDVAEAVESNATLTSIYKKMLSVAI